MGEMPREVRDLLCESANFWRFAAGGHAGSRK
ncbi:Uncharacterised protein [Escherichia coli]|uniref:Uncharacterized protein n=1 Tax=Escherichia coli TaxID=562 RepID=A0A376KUK5_ECOLX|nr:Uncharacterised protein [Escherichia coli]